MVKKLTIECCEECKYRSCEWDDSFCYHDSFSDENGRFITDIYEIPDWCPLENADG